MLPMLYISKMLILCMLFIGQANSSTWNISNGTLPNSDDEMIVAYDADTNLAWIIGGYAYKYQLTAFNLTSETVTYYKEDTFPIYIYALYGSGQYTQIGDTVYFQIPDNTQNKFATFTLSTQTYTSDWKDVTVPNESMMGRCITHIKRYLMVIGGFGSPDGYHTAVHIYDITNDNWLNTVPNMNFGRRGPQCVVHPNTKHLYVIGGRGDGGILTSIEKIYVGDMNNVLSFKLLSSTFTARAQFEAQIYGNSIYIFGGYTYPATDLILTTIIDVVDTSTDLISSIGELPYGLYSSPSIIANQKIYIFGGNDEWVNHPQFRTENRVIYYQLSPTTVKYPTSEPTIKPTSTTTTTTPTVTTSIIATSNMTTKKMTSTTLLIDISNDQHELEIAGLSKLYQFTVGGFIIFCILTILIGIIDAKLIRRNDYFKITILISMLLQMSDLISDIFFVIQIDIEHKIYLKFEYDLIMYSSILFILLPSLTTLFQIYFHAKKNWLYDNYVRSWLTKYATILFVLSVVLGNSFNAISILNSFMFQLEIFNMGLTERQLKKFNTKRVYSVVLLENIPQIGLQSYYLWSVGNIESAITISSIIFSSISIIVSIMNMIMQKTIIHTEKYTILSMNITGKCIMENLSKCRAIKNELKEQMSILFEIDINSIEIIKPTYISKGLSLNVHIYESDDNKKHVDYKQILIHGESNKIFKHCWKLEHEPSIDNIQSVVIESKQRKYTKTQQQIDNSEKKNDGKTVNEMKEIKQRPTVDNKKNDNESKTDDHDFGANQHELNDNHDIDDSDYIELEKILNDQINDNQCDHESDGDIA